MYLQIRCLILKTAIVVAELRVMKKMLKQFWLETGNNHHQFSRMFTQSIAPHAAVLKVSMN